MHNNPSFVEHGELNINNTNIDANRMFLQERGWSSEGPLAMSDELHTWFEQFDTSSQAVTDHVGDETTLISNIGAHLSPTQRTVRMRTMSGSAISVDSAVPNERFTKVEQCWPHKAGTRARAMHTLWQDMCSPTVTTELGETETGDYHTRGRSSGWKLDEETRTRIEEVFGKVSGKKYPCFLKTAIN